MKLKVSVETPIEKTIRVVQTSAMFDVPLEEKTRLSWEIDAPIEDKTWSVGLIVGPSGSGKTTCAREMFGDKFDVKMKWSHASLVDDFSSAHTIADTVNVCSSVGFNTIPAWFRPYEVLSNGEKFRVDLARRLLELDSPIVVDEFTSVVDRQVAKIGSHAVAKYVRRNGKQFVAVTCHEDVIDWLQPDWVLNPSDQSFRWRSVQPRPTINIDIRAVSRDVWKHFAKFHYMTSELPGGRYYGAFVDSTIVGFLGVCKVVHPSVSNLWRIARVVTLPDWQGIGVAWVLMESVAEAFARLGMRMRVTPAHPAFANAAKRSPRWKMIRALGKTSSFSTSGPARRLTHRGEFMRMNSIFEYQQTHAYTLTENEALRVFNARDELKH